MASLPATQVSRGRPQGYYRQQFAETGMTGSGERRLLVCIHCRAAYNDTRRVDRPAVPTFVAARSSNYPSHLKKCKFYKEALASGKSRPPPPEQPTLPSLFQLQQASSAYSAAPVASRSLSVSTNSSFDRGHDTVSSTGSDKRQRRMRDYYASVFNEEDQAEFERLLVQFQADNNLTDRFIEKKSTRRLFVFLNRACEKALPNRFDLGNRILNQYSTVNEEEQFQALRNRQRYTKGRVNFLSDVWMNTSKTHLLGCQLGLYGIISSYGLFPTGSRHDGLAIAEQMEKTMKDIETKGWNIGGVVTDNAGQCDRARRILALRWPNLAFIHCFAHDCNNLVKAVLNSSYQKVTKLASQITVTLNQSSSKWLPRAKSSVTTVYGKTLGFINLCETRWNSMQGCFASLLRVKTALEQFADEYESDPEFPESLKTLKDPTFWSRLASAEEVIRPLSNASFKLQRDENTLADVVASYRDIYRGFVGNLDNLELVSILEGRWKQCEQPLMLLAVFLHPRHVCLARAIMDSSPRFRLYERICGYGIYYYRKYFGTDDVENLADEMHRWKHGIFFENPSLCRFTGDVGGFWACAADISFGTKLPKLAAVILSIAVNTATCERYFSELSGIHTAVKNRLSPEKSRKFSLVRKAVRQIDAAENGRAQRSHLKRIIEPTERKFAGNCAAPPDVTLTEIEESHIILDQAVPDPETLEYWQEVFDVLESDESTVNDDGSTEEPPANEDDAFVEVSQMVFSGADEAIPEPNKTEFPNYNMKNFPLEKKLTGIRGQKFRLQTLFSSDRTFGLRPYSEYAE